MVDIVRADDICIINLSQEPTSINEALRNASAPYVAFVDDFMAVDEGYFRELISALEDYPECSIASGSLRKGTNAYRIMLEGGLPKKTCILDSQVNFAHAMVYPYGSVVKTEALKASQVFVDASFTFCRDELFSLLLNAAYPQRVFVPTALCKSKRIYDETSKNIPQSQEKAWYTDSTIPLLNALREKLGYDLPRFVQFALLYLTWYRFKANEKTAVKAVFESLEETDGYFAGVREVMRTIDDSVLFSRRPAIKLHTQRLLYFASLRSVEPLDLEVRQSNSGKVELFIAGSDSDVPIETMGVHQIQVQYVRYVQSKGSYGLAFDLVFPTCFPHEFFSVILCNTYLGEDHVSQAHWVPQMGSRMTYFNRVAYLGMTYKVFVPLAQKKCEQVITAHAVVGGKVINLKLGIWDQPPSHMRENIRECKWLIPHYSVFSYNWAVCVCPASGITKFVDQVKYNRFLRAEGNEGEHAASVRILYWLTRPYFKRKRIWAYYDKGFKGGDNGEYAWKYAIQQNDDIQHVYFIEDEVTDGKRLIQKEGLGEFIVRPRTRKALLYALNAEVIFATHTPAYRIVGIMKTQCKYYTDIMRAQIVRMYHGFVLRHDPSYTRAFMGCSGVVVGSRYEHDLYLDPVHGFKDEEIITSGMPRYDGLTPNNQRQILFAPTWRPTLRAKRKDVREQGSIYNPDFKQSRYYQTYAAIFNDSKLLETARECNYKIKLFLHPLLAPQTVDFKSNDVFESLDCTKDTDYVSIMRASDLMVTDYSSVMVDFAYTRKPVVYFHDPGLPYWSYVDFDYEGLGFGEVCKNRTELVNLLCEYMKSDCELKDKYRKRIDDFFYFNDFCNAERLYNRARAIFDNKRL